MKTCLSTVAALAILLSTALTSQAATSTFVTPAQEGIIFAVVNFDRTLGSNRNTSYNVAWGNYRKSDVVLHPYGNCSSSTPAGFVLMLSHTRPDASAFTLTTNGAIVRGPYQGEPPAEISHPCYKFVKLRAVNR